MDTDLKGKIVLITGASSGIGEACARRFAKAGCRLILVARRLERLRKLSTDLGSGIETHIAGLDVRNRQAVESVLGSLPTGWSEVDILVNNAGLSRDLSKLHEGNPDSWDQMIDTNIKGLLYVSRAIIPGMVGRGRGHVINIGSIAGHEVYPAGNVYCATKFAVDAITKGMRLDLVDTPVRVSTIDPGLVQTEFSLVRFYGDSERAAKVYQGLKPLTGDDIADVAVWIACRPEHVQVAEVIVLPKAQASTMVVQRK